MDYTGETATFASNTLDVRVVSAEDDGLELWACQKRGDELWIAEVTLTLPATTTLPANFGFNAGAPQITAWLTRYDKYQVLEDELGDGLSARVTGRLEALERAGNGGNVSFNATLSEPCARRDICLADNRTLAIEADLNWDAP
jgi:hypothetical protein